MFSSGRTKMHSSRSWRKFILNTHTQTHGGGRWEGRLQEIHIPSKSSENCFKPSYSTHLTFSVRHQAASTGDIAVPFISVCLANAGRTGKTALRLRRSHPSGKMFSRTCLLFFIAPFCLFLPSLLYSCHSDSQGCEGYSALSVREQWEKRAVNNTE